MLVDHINAELRLPTGGHVGPNEHPLFLNLTETIGKTAGHIDVSIWYTLKGDRSQTLAFDDSEFVDARWFHKGALPLDRTDKHMARFLQKLFA